MPQAWRGSLPFTYHAGRVQRDGAHENDYDWTNKTIYDVIATIPGLNAPDEWVMAGNHYDAWVNGADDPVCGARRPNGNSSRAWDPQRQGWNPKRTIKLAFGTEKNSDLWGLLSGWKSIRTN